MRILVGLGLLGVLWCAPVGYAETGSDTQAATEFFNKIARESDNPVLAKAARESAARLNQTTPPSTTQRHRIRLFSQADDSIAVPAVLNGKTVGTFIVDTGASYTVITPRMAKKLGVDVESVETVSVLTGNGVIKAPLVTLKDVMIGQIHVSEVKAVVQDLGGDLIIAGVLGMNFFKGKTITIQQDSLILEEVSDTSKLSSR